MAIFNREIVQTLLESSKDDPYIIKRYFVKSDNGVDNCCVIVNGYNHPMRGRSSMITLDIRKDNIYMLCKNNKNQNDYGVPGGGWNKGETPKQAAIRELHEETLCDIKDVKPEGLLIEYRKSKDKVNDWVKKHVQEDEWWYGYYSKIFVGLYNGKFTGKVKEEDREGGFTWKKINDILKDLPKEYQNAINNYLKESK